METSYVADDRTGDRSQVGRHAVMRRSDRLEMREVDRSVKHVNLIAKPLCALTEPR